MASTIKVKRSAVQGKAPTTGNLDAGELALNTRDGRLYSKGTQVFEVGANNHSLYVGTGGATFANGAFSLPTSDGTADQVIKTNGSGVLSWTNQSGGDLTGSVPFYAYDNTLDTINLTSQISSTALANTNSYIATKADIADSSFTGNTAFDTNTLFVDGTNNRVGIGVTSPASPLEIQYDTDISMNSSGTGHLQIDGNAYNFGIALDSDGAYIYTNSSTRHLVFGTNETEQMRITGAGIVTTPNQIAFLAKIGTDQTLTVGSAVVIDYDTEVYDTGSDFATSTNTFTAPVTGKYLLTFGLRINSVDSSGSYYRPQIYTSNRNYYDIFDPAGYDSTTSYQSFTMSVIADMDASDIAKVYVRQQGGSASVVSNVADHSWFSGYLLG